MHGKIRCLWMICLMLSIQSCELDDALDRSGVLIEETYFIECYLQPNKLYNLTATEIQPIFDDFILDYSLDFDVFIIGRDTTELYQSLFIDDETGFVFNYGRGVRLDSTLDQVSLFVLTPTEDTVMAMTDVPDPIVIKTSECIDSSVNTKFDISNDTKQNFYLHIVNYATYEKDTIQQRVLTQFLDLTTVNVSTYEAEVALENRIDSLDIEITLMRVTEDNYRYQRSLSQAKEASDGKVTYPAPIEGNLVGAEGIFTCYQVDFYTITEN